MPGIEGISAPTDTVSPESGSPERACASLMLQSYSSTCPAETQVTAALARTWPCATCGYPAITAAMATSMQRILLIAVLVRFGSLRISCSGTTGQFCAPVAHQAGRAGEQSAATQPGRRK